MFLLGGERRSFAARSNKVRAIACQRVNRGKTAPHPYNYSVDVTYVNGADIHVQNNGAGSARILTVACHVPLLAWHGWVLEDAVMTDLYGDRMGALRQRFAEQLDSRIEGIENAILQLEDDDFDDLAKAHRDAHHLCGVGATLGFVGTGTIARRIEQILLAAVKAGRALTDDEVPCLRAGIALLRSTANVEMRSAH